MYRVFSTALTIGLKTALVTVLMMGLLAVAQAGTQAGAPAGAQNKSSGAGFALDSAMVLNFLQALGQIQDISNKSGQGLSGRKLQASGTAQAPFSNAMEAIRNHAAAKQMKAAIKDAGFDDGNRWAAVGSRVFRTYGALKREKHSPRRRVQIAQAGQRAQKSKTDAQRKADILRSLTGQSTRFLGFRDVSNADRAAVRPHLALIDQIGRRR